MPLAVRFVVGCFAPLSRWRRHLSLERRREQREQPPPLPLTLPDDPRVRDQVVRPQALADYDQLNPRSEPHDDDHP